MILYFISVTNRKQQESSLVRLSELETTGLDNQLSQGIDMSVGTKINVTGQDGHLFTHLGFPSVRVVLS